ncbi:MAG: zinc ABC transporter substrate-binding protein [Propionibacteriaceae bacterium]|nr:zinc ABC transporter substrate-binding protein [Propionibacteriaceae bacterium]
MFKTRRGFPSLGGVAAEPTGWSSAKRRGGLAVALALALAFLGAGCAAPPPQDGKPQIVAAMYPFAFLAGSITGDRADVTTLVPPGTEPHDYELTPHQIAQLKDATLVVYQKGVDAAIDTAVAQSAPARVVETGSLVQLLLASSDGADTGEATGGYADDPHTWLDPNNMMVFAEAVAEAISAADPANAAAYQANLATLTAQLTSLDASYRSGLTGCQRTSFLTTHAAFGYLAKQYGLQQLAIAGVTPEDEPSPKRLAEIAATARSLGLTTVFFETLISPDYANTLATDLGLRTDVLDPIEGLSAASRGADYLQIMASNLEALRQANGCG